MKYVAEDNLDVPLIPCDDRVLVLREPVKTKTESGLIIPEEAQEKANKGTIIAVGPGRMAADGVTTIPVRLKVGDVVLIGKYGGVDFKVDGDDFMVIKENDILGVFQ